MAIQTETGKAPAVDTSLPKDAKATKPDNVQVALLNDHPEYHPGSGSNIPVRNLPRIPTGHGGSLGADHRGNGIGGGRNTKIDGFDLGNGAYSTYNESSRRGHSTYSANFKSIDPLALGGIAIGLGVEATALVGVTRQFVNTLFPGQDPRVAYGPEGCVIGDGARSYSIPYDQLIGTGVVDTQQAAGQLLGQSEQGRIGCQATLDAAAGGARVMPGQLNEARICVNQQAHYQQCLRGSVPEADTVPSGVMLAVDAKCTARAKAVR